MLNQCTCKTQIKEIIFWHNRSVFTVLNAVDRSQISKPVISPASEFWIQFVCMAVKAFIVDLDVLKPCWLSGRRPLLSMNLVTWSQTIFQEPWRLPRGS